MKFSFFPTIIGFLVIILGVFALTTGELGYHEVIVRLRGPEKYFVGVIAIGFGFYIILLGAKKKRKNNWKL